LTDEELQEMIDKADRDFPATGVGKNFLQRMFGKRL